MFLMRLPVWEIKLRLVFEVSVCCAVPKRGLMIHL